MQTIILVVHLVLALALVGVVLLQRSEGGLGGLGGAGGGGGMGGLIGGRTAANLLTRATGVLAGSFFLTSIVLAILAGDHQGPISIIQEEPGASEQAPVQPPQPAVPTVPTGE